MATTGYSKSDAAKKLGISKAELEQKAKAAGFDNTEAYYNFIGGAAAPMIQQITQQIVDLDRQLDGLPGISLTDQEKQNFLDKAITQVQPYYDRKTAEIQKGVQEGKIRSAEDVLLYTRDVQNEVQTTLSNLDLRQAQTEEDFLNRLADITAGKDENLASKRDEWKYKLENIKLQQVQSGNLTEGIGAKVRGEAQATQNLSEQQTIAQAGRAQTGLETAKNYDVEQIRLAREAAARDRASRIGAPDQTQAQQQAMGALGINDLSQLGSKSQIELARSQDQRNVPIYNPSALTNLQEERLKAVEQTKQELQQQELDTKNLEYEKQRQKILADKAAAQSKLTAYRGY